MACSTSQTPLGLACKLAKERMKESRQQTRDAEKRDRLATMCGALTPRGKVCHRDREPGEDRCRWHRGQPSALRPDLLDE